MQDPLHQQYHGRASDLLQRLRTEEDWDERGQQAAFDLFHEMAQRVPAYADFLQQHQVKPESIKTAADLAHLPLINKENYLQHYDKPDLCWDGQFAQQGWVVASTSGSTGKPYYFPRSPEQDRQFELTAELTLLEYFEIDRHSTLFIDCFALGVWIGGMFMYQAVKYLIDSGNYPLSMITPGADKVETLKAIKGLAGQFDQVILGGYGPLVKDLVDEGLRQGINWSDYNMKYFFAAEGFTEGFRDYIGKYGGVKDVYTGTINHYGTADMGTMAHETPLTTVLRKRALDQEDLYAGLFREANRLPTFAQYIPELYYFEEIEDRLVCSSRSGLPLLRYDLKDRGGVSTYDEMMTLCERQGFDVMSEAKRLGFENKLWKLPFVYLYERTDFTINIYSVNVYPESVRRALEQNHLEQQLTGKFCMLVDFDDQQNQFFEINVELKPDVTSDDALEEQTAQAIIDTLNCENSEWRDFYGDEGIRHKITPRLNFCSYQDPQYFKPGGKQKWSKKVAL